MGESKSLKDDLIRELQGLDTGVELIIKEFDLESISDDASFLTREIAKRVKERIKEFAQLLEDLIVPDAGLSSLNECGFFTEEERDELAKSYRELMALSRSFTLADLEATSKAYRSFLERALPCWEAQKEFLRETIKKLEREWQREEPVHRSQSYLG